MPGTTDSASDDVMDEMSAAFGELAEAVADDTETPETTDDVETAEREDSTPSAAADETETATPQEPRQPVGATADSEHPDSPAVADDPLKDAQPFTYVVDGQARTLEGAHLITGPDGQTGAIIPAAVLPALQQRLSRAEHDEAQNRELYHRVQEYERLEFKEAKGLDAFAQALTENARLTAAVTLLVQHIEDPQKVVALATDANALQLLQERLGVVTEKAALAAGKQWGERIQQSREAATTAPEQLGAMLNQHFDALAPQVPGLTKADWDEAKTIFGPFASQIIHRATPDEARAANVKVGSLVVNNNAFLGWLDQRVKQRAEEAKAKAAQAQTDAENKKRLAAANAGKKPAPTGRPGAGKETPKPKQPTYQEIARAAQAGRFLPEIVGEED